MRATFAVAQTSDAAAAAAAASSSLAAGITARRVLLQRRDGRQRHEPSRRGDEVPRRVTRVILRRAALVEARRNRVKVRWSPLEIQRRDVVLFGRSRDGRRRRSGHVL